MKEQRTTGRTYGAAPGPARFWRIVVLLSVAWFPCCAGVSQSAISFYDDVKPVLAVHCYPCHAGEAKKGGLLLDTLPHALAGGKSGHPALVAGASGRSELARRITSDDPEEQMPPKGPRLTESEVRRIKQWIDAGAKWPERDDYWAFQPPKEQD